MPTTITGQNGREVKQDTVIKPTGCGVQVEGHRVIAGTAYLKVKTFEAGRLSVSGPGVATVYRTLGAANGSAALKVKLFSTGLAGAPSTVRLRVGFKPARPRGRASQADMARTLASAQESLARIVRSARSRTRWSRPVEALPALGVARVEPQPVQAGSCSKTAGLRFARGCERLRGRPTRYCSGRGGAALGNTSSATASSPIAGVSVSRGRSRSHGAARSPVGSSRTLLPSLHDGVAPDPRGGVRPGVRRRARAARRSRRPADEAHDAACGSRCRDRCGVGRPPAQ